MGGDVPQIIRSKHHAPANLVLDSEINLHRARCLVVRSEQVDSVTVWPRVTRSADVCGIRPKSSSARRGLKLRLECRKLGLHLTDRRTADVSKIDRCGKGQLLWHPISAGRLEIQKAALLQPPRPVKKNVVPDRVLVEQTNSTPQYRLSVTGRVPCQSKLRSEILVGLVYPILQSGIELIVVSGERRNRRQIAVSSAGITHVTQPVSHSQIRSDLPGVTRVERNAIIGS